GFPEFAPEQPDQLSGDPAGPAPRVRHCDRAHWPRSRVPLSGRGRCDAQGRTCPVYPPRPEALVNRLGSTLLRIGLFLLPISLGHSAESLGDGQGVAPVSAYDGVVISAISAIPMHAVGSGAPQRALDLRLPDSRSLHIQDPQQPETSPESDEANATTVVGTRLLLDQRAGTQSSFAGIGSLYWAVRHPTQAWRVFLPILLDGDEADSE